MKTSLLAISHLISVWLFAGWAQCDDLPSKEVELLIRSAPASSYPPKDVDEWRLRVRSQKGITQDLLIMIKQEKDWERIGKIFAALSARTDLTPEMLGDLKEPLDDILSKDPQSDMLMTNYAVGLIGLLRNFPSDEHERLLLSVLDRQDGTYNTPVFESLASIGTAESLIPLKEILKAMNQRDGSRGDPATLENTIVSIEKRINANERKSNRDKTRRPTSPVSRNDGGKVSAESDSESEQMSSSDKRSTNQWLVWGGLVLGGIIFILIFIQKQSNR